MLELYRGCTQPTRVVRNALMGVSNKKTLCLRSVESDAKNRSDLLITKNSSGENIYIYNHIERFSNNLICWLIKDENIFRAIVQFLLIFNAISIFTVQIRRKWKYFPNCGAIISYVKNKKKTSLLVGRLLKLKGGLSNRFPDILTTNWSY